MESEVLALVVRARDEASTHFTKIEGALDKLARKADVTGRAMGALHSVLQGIGVGIGLNIFTNLEEMVHRLIDLIPGLIEKGMAFGEMVHNVSEATGASAERVSRLLGTFEFLGIATDGLGMKLGRLAKFIVDHADKMAALGIATVDVHGKTLDMVTIVDNARRALSTYGAGADRTAASVRLFGRAGADLIEYLSMTDEQVKLLNDEMDRLGVTIDESGSAKAENLSREFRLFGLATQGVANTLLNDVAPALMGFVDQLAGWVQANGRNIATFAAQVVNFVLGMVSALTGAKFETVSFSDKFAALGAIATSTGLAVDDAAASTDKAAGASKRAIAAIDKQTKAIDDQLASLKALETEQDKAFTKALDGLGAQVKAQLDAIDAAEKAHRLDEQRLSLAKQLADAQASLAEAQAGAADRDGNTVVDPKAVQGAADRVAEIVQNQADLETGVVDDARRAQLGAIQDYLNQIATAEKDATDKTALLAQQKAEEQRLQSQIAAAQAANDLQTVADLSIELQGLQTAEVRTQDAIRNQTAEDTLNREKERLAALKAAASAAGSGIGKSIKAGALVGQGAIDDLTTHAVDHFGLMGEALTGKDKSVTSAMEAARLAGINFGTSLQKVIADGITAISGLIDAIGGIGRAFDNIGTGWKYLTDPAFAKTVNDAARNQGVTPPIDDRNLPFVIPGATGNIPGKASGGPVDAGGTYVVGERGPEILRMGRNRGSITPNGGGAIQLHVNVQGAALFDPYGQAAQQIAEAMLPGLRRELTRQGMSLG